MTRSRQVALQKLRKEFHLTQITLRRSNKRCSNYFNATSVTSRPCDAMLPVSIGSPYRSVTRYLRYYLVNQIEIVWNISSTFEINLQMDLDVLPALTSPYRSIVRPWNSGRSLYLFIKQKSKWLVRVSGKLILKWGRRYPGKASWSSCQVKFHHPIWMQ